MEKIVKMLLFRLCVVAVLVSISAGTAISFMEQDIRIRLRSSGSVSLGRIEESEGGDEKYLSVSTFAFSHLQVKGQGTEEHFSVGDRSFQLNSSGFYNFGNRLVEGKSMAVNITSIGVTLSIEVMVVKDATLPGERRGIRARDVMINLELAPQNKNAVGCVVCEGNYVIELGVNVTHHGGDTVESDDIREIDGYQAIGFEDTSTLYFPDEVQLNGMTSRADLIVTSHSNVHSLQFTFPTPLRRSISADVIFDVGEGHHYAREETMADDPARSHEPEAEEAAAQDGVVGESRDKSLNAGNDHHASSLSRNLLIVGSLAVMLLLQV